MKIVSQFFHSYENRAISDKMDHFSHFLKTVILYKLREKFWLILKMGTKQTILKIGTFWSKLKIEILDKLDKPEDFGQF